MSDRKSVILAAMLKVEEEDFTQAGVPSLDALNLILEVDGEEPATDAERDEYWAEFAEMAPEDDEPATEADPGFSEVTVTSASSDPVKLYVHGVGTFSMIIGKACRIPTEALDTLKNSDVKFKIGGDA